MNTTEFDRLYRMRVNATGLTGSTVRLSLDRVDPGTLRTLTHVAIENKTNAYTKCRLSIYNGATDLNIDEADFPQADELLTHKQDIIMGEGDLLRATLTGTTTGDDLELLAVGWEKTRERP